MHRLTIIKRNAEEVRFFLSAKIAEYFQDRAIANSKGKNDVDAVVLEYSGNVRWSCCAWENPDFIR